MAPKKGSVLANITDEMAIASRYVENGAFDRATEAYNKGWILFCAYTPTEEEAADYAVIRAEMHILNAVVRAHEESLEMQQMRFEAAITLTQGDGLEPFFLTRARCCYGAWLIFRKRFSKAIEVLESIEDAQAPYASQHERIQVTYHLARAYAATGQRKKAQLLLTDRLPKRNNSLLVMEAGRYHLASILLLANLLWSWRSPRSRREARYWLKWGESLSRRFTLSTSRQSRELEFAETYGIALYRLRLSMADSSTIVI